MRIWAVRILFVLVILELVINDLVTIYRLNRIDPRDKPT